MYLFSRPNQQQLFDIFHDLASALQNVAIISKNPMLWKKLGLYLDKTRGNISHAVQTSCTILGSRLL